jgi:predicted dehydrogenase
MAAIRVGVWGVGTWGEKHARVFHALDEAALAGVWDTDVARAAEVAERYGTRAFPSAAALLAACEAVTVATPTVEHRAAVEQAARSGRHVLVEKPMAPTLEDAEAMRAAAARAGVTLQVGHVERFNPALIAARPHVREPKFIEAHRLALFQPRSLDIDVVFDLMIHDIDIVLECVGASPSRVSAVGVAVLSGSEDIANARLEFDDGCVANLTASRVSQDRLRRIRFFQADAYLSVDLFEKSGELLRVAPLPAREGAAEPSRGLPAIGKSKLAVPPGEPLTLELRAFLRSLRGDGAGAAPAEAGCLALGVAEAVRAEMKRRTLSWSARSSAVS